MTSGPRPENHFDDGQLHPQDPEPRWPGLLVLLVVAGLHWLLPAHLAAGPSRFAVAAIALVALLAHLLHRWHDPLGYAASAIATFALVNALVVLIWDLSHHLGEPRELLFGALLIWSMNIFVFASWYWRLDAGGPRSRSRRGGVYCGGAFLFPQLSLAPETRKAIHADGWRPRFIDYLFVAFNVSTAFSPTDVPVLSAWAKVLMMTQASISLVTLAIVAARAVNIL
jgi:hypothetical protein